MFLKPPATWWDVFPTFGSRLYREVQKNRIYGTEFTSSCFLSKHCHWELLPFFGDKTRKNITKNPTKEILVPRMKLGLP